MWLTIVITTALTSTPVTQVEQGVKKAIPPPVTMAANFTQYCQQADSNEWFCKVRREAIPDSQKWQIVGGYCFETVGLPRVTDPAQQQKWIESLAASTDAGPRGSVAVCEAFRRVPVPLALEYNHRANKWSSVTGGFEAGNRKLSLDPVLMVPVVSLKPGDRLGLIVTETNPLLYVANRGEAKEENVDQVKGLEQLLSVLGPALGTAAVSLADRVSDLQADIASLQTSPSQEVRDRYQMYFAASTDRPRFLDEISDFSDDLKTLKEATDAAKSAVEPARSRLEKLLDQRTRLQIVGQQLENGPALLTGTLDQTLEDPQTWRQTFLDLRAAAKGLTAVTGCSALFDAFAEVVAAKPDEPIALEIAATRFLHFFSTGTDADTTVCNKLKYDQRLREPVSTIRSAAQTLIRNPSDAALAALRSRQADARERHLERVLILEREIAELDAAKQKIKEADAKEEETRKASLVLGLVGSRARDAVLRQDAKGLLLTNRIFVEDEIYSSGLLKVRTTPLKITLNSQISDNVPTDRPKETITSYKLSRLGLERLSFGLGMLAFAPVFNATYTAIDPDPSSNTSVSTTTTVTPQAGTTQTTVVAQPELKRIKEKERQTRSGSYAAFVSYRAFGNSALGVGGQFGVATSADSPALIGGLSLHFSKFVTVGIGGGRFRVKRLDPDQDRDDIRVLSADEIRTMTRWLPSSYVSLSINISGLPLFK
jgi:hypothetical protein